MANIVPPEKWNENFRMSRCTFYSLCEQLGPYDEGQPMRMLEPIEVDRQVAVTINWQMKAV